MSRVIVIGIDGMDSGLVDNYQPDLPNLRKLKEQGAQIKMRSVFPPDSTPAWTSIYTGLNPAQHGVLNFVNMADKKNSYQPLKITDDNFKGKTFWDLAGEQGKTVCVVLPLLISPGWPVKGAMVCRSSEIVNKNRLLSAFPAAILKKYKYRAEELNLIHGFISQKGLPKFKQACLIRTEAEADLGLQLLKNEPWELFFIFFSALDGIQHYFWGQKEVVKEFYVLMDNIIGKFLSAAGSDATGVILSDHGHGLRPEKLININELLQQKGFLKAKKGIAKRSQAAKQMKKNFISFVRHHGAASWLVKASQSFPVWKKILAPASIIDWENTLAYASDLSTVKSYSYGGIRLNRQMKGQDKESLLKEIIAILGEVENPENGGKLVRMAKKREDLYSGEHINKYPELVVELDENYGMGWEISGPVFSEGDIHLIQPGSHKRSTPVLFFSKPAAANLSNKEATLMDIKPAILSLLGAR